MMAAGRQKKRLASSNVHEQYRGKKKKKLDPSDYVLTLRSHVHLEWDDRQKRAVPKKEQIGVTWTDMAPFVDFAPQSRSGLADVLSVPREIFSLDNLMEVLSHEVWATCLSEPERKLLTQFLPGGTGAEQVVHSLLMGENHHFGNPLLKWSTSLCSGDLHPDKVLQSEQQCRANRKGYYWELNKYHNDMLEVLKMWKEKWTSCKDPEKLWRQGLVKHKQESLSVSTEGTRISSISKKDVLHEVCVGEDNAAKYMSCVKITKKQLQLLKNMKQSGDGIAPKSLNRVLGDIKGFVIEPYETFEGKEKKRLHDHWLRIAVKDAPAAFDNWSDRKLQKEKWSKCLKQELGGKKLVMNKAEEMNKLATPLEVNMKEGKPEHDYTVDSPSQEDVSSPLNTKQDHEFAACLTSYCELNPAVPDERELDQGSVIGAAESSPVLPQFAENQNVDDAIEPKDLRALAEDQSKPAQTSPLFPQFASKMKRDVVKPENEESLSVHLFKPAEGSRILPQFLEKRNPADDLMEPMSAAEATNVWRSARNRGTYYQSTPEIHERPAVGGLSLSQLQQVEKHQAQAINLESNVLEQEARDSNPSPFHSYTNQEHNELLPPLPGGPLLLSSYPQDHMNGLKPGDLSYMMANNSLPESDQFSHQFQQQQMLMDQRHAREKDLYLHQIMNKNVYPNGKYPIQRHFSSLNPQNLPALPSSPKGGLPSHSWFADDHRASNGWSGLELSASGQNLGDGVNTDGSLFSVLSECRKLPSRSTYDDDRSSEQFSQTRHLVGDGIASDEHMYGYAPQQLSSTTNHESAASPAPALNNMSWMNFPHQHRRSWNQ